MAVVCRYACVFSLFLPLLFACSKPLPDEKQIAAAIEQLQQATEKKQLRTVMQFFSDDFRGRHQMNKAALQARVYMHFRQNPRVTVYVSNVDIQMNKDQATVSCHLLVTGSQDVMPDKGRLYRIESAWRKDKGTWRIFKADWKDIFVQQVP